ncbi:PaaI family thioesterase [Solihabitans fulvus]|uniref:PaaI family thioesterase n=1 Tax=Solihabitans fulvus TaxID=1892852 RepID=UPI001661E1E3|nr:PaaI family thioesterase [Solihabitans fulvus]
MSAETGGLLGHHPHCFGCGQANHGGLRLAVRWHGDEARFEHTPPAHAEGGPGLAHGGYLAALVDEVAALVGAEYAGEPLMTRRVEITYSAPVLLGEPLSVRAWVEETGKRRVVLRIEASTVASTGDSTADSATPCFTARCLMLRVPKTVWLKLMAKRQSLGQLDWERSDPSLFLHWQMNGGLRTVLDTGRLPGELRIAVDVPDARPAEWTIVAGPDGLDATQGAPAESDARFHGPFRQWQQLIHRTVALDAILAEPSVRVEGSTQALAAFAEALDFGRHA